MYDFKVKVCGITREKDALAAVKYGADILGFIFYKKSPRFVSVVKANKIISVIPPTVIRVGVFVNEDKIKVLKTAQNLQLDFIQLSGNEPQSDIRFLLKNGFKIIKTIAVATQNDIEKVKKFDVDVIHLDCADTKLYGGSGKQFNWNLKLPKSLKNIMLAGGINSGNVAKGIKKFKPLIIDVNSGVEFKPGYKSEKLLQEFFKRVNKIRYGK